MNKVRIYILTTEGPSQVQRLVAEDPEVRSVVCLNGTTEALPISPAYDAFVRTPTGIIERHYGHPVFRMDVSEPISEGRSWQLGALLAHALNAGGRLASGDETADTVLLLTGEVDRDLNVLGVGHVPEKLRAAASLLDGLAASDAKVLLGLPQANRSEATGVSGVEVLPVACAAELLDRVELTVPGIPAEHVSKGTGFPWVPAAVLAVFAFTVGVGLLVRQAGNGSDTTGSAPAVIKQESAAAGLQLFELRPPEGSNCAAVRFGVAETVRVPLPPHAPGRYRSYKLDSLCGMDIESTAGMGTLDARLLAGGEVGAQALTALSADDSKASQWRLRFGKRLRQPLHYQLTLQSADGKTIELEHKIERQ